MTAKYLIRFDDMCSTMNWDVWSEVEQILIEAKVRPILSVIPDNHDESLRIICRDIPFWGKVKTWQQKGWTIGLHGYQHRYVTKDPGIIGLNKRSEFAGLPIEEQERKISQAVAIFHAQGIHPDIWIAPAHSFDGKTIHILQKYGVRSINDGYYLFPHTDRDGVFWLPQQLWRFRLMPLGVWTVCHHHNRWSKREIRKFRLDVVRYRNDITDVGEIVRLFQGRRPTWADRLFSCLFLYSLRTKRFIRNRG